MANLTETNRWEAGIYQLETSDPVMGGPNGSDNRAPRELANRTLASCAVCSPLRGAFGAGSVLPVIADKTAVKRDLIDIIKRQDAVNLAAIVRCKAV